MSTPPPKVAILIMTWNDLRNTAETLTSVRSLQHPCFEVWVVDNGSTDGSLDVIASQFPEVHLLPSSENLGVAGGRNFGLEHILPRPDVDYVLILDNDVAVEPLLLDKLVEAAEAEPDIGIVGPIVHYQADPRRIRSNRALQPAIFHGRQRNRVLLPGGQAGIRGVSRHSR